MNCGTVGGLVVVRGRCRAGSRRIEQRRCVCRRTDLDAGGFVLRFSLRKWSKCSGSGRVADVAVGIDVVLAYWSQCWRHHWISVSTRCPCQKSRVETESTRWGSLKTKIGRSRTLQVLTESSPINSKSVVCHNQLVLVVMGHSLSCHQQILPQVRVL